MFTRVFRGGPDPYPYGVLKEKTQNIDIGRSRPGTDAELPDTMNSDTAMIIGKCGVHIWRMVHEKPS